MTPFKSLFPMFLHMPLRRYPRSCHAPPAGYIGALLILVLSGCGGAPAAALQVGDVTFDHASLAGLSHQNLSVLAGITVLQEGLANPPEEILLRQRRIEQLREETILRAAGVSEADLEAQYETQPAWELEVRHLVILAEPWEPLPVRAAARSRAQEALAEILAGAPFEEVAGRWSEEPGAAPRGGLLRPGREGTWVQPFWKAALALAEGEVSGVVETPFGFHVLRLDARRVIPFSEARSGVVRQVAARLGGGEAWEALRDAWVESIEIVPPEEAPRPAFRHLFDLIHLGENPAPFDPVLARWPGGELTHSTFVRDLLDQSMGAVMAAGTHAETMEARLQTAAEQRLLETRAEAAGIVLAPTDIAGGVQAWTQQARGWVAVLGLAADGPPEARAARALEALRRTGQNASIARDEIREAAPTLLSHVPLVWDPALFP